MSEAAIPLTEIQADAECSSGSLGKPTIAAGFFLQRSQMSGHTTCIFLCLKRGSGYYAIDIPIDKNKPNLGLYRLRRESGPWWKRWSMYSATGVQEVNMRVMNVDGPEYGQQQLRVCILEKSYIDDISQFEEAIRTQLRGVVKECGCDEMDVNGNLTHPNGLCVNDTVDEAYGDTCCSRRRAQELTQQLSDHKWLSSMLKYYWQHGIDDKGLDLLGRVGFVHSYARSRLQYDTYSDAASPYGREIPAFLLIEGWHVRYMLVLVGVGLASTVCVVAIAAALTQSLDVALTAGSYACGLAGALIAVFTFLSAVL